MTDFRERYKRAGYGREDPEVNRALRSQRRDEARREMRSEHFSLRRDLEQEEEEEEEEQQRLQEDEQEEQEVEDHEEEAKRKAAADLETAVQNRLIQLEKWREERNRRRLQEKKKAKPVFKVGVVHHRVYSPPMTKEPVPIPTPKLCKSKEAHKDTPLPKRVTRATEKRLAVKAVTNQQKRENLKSRKVKVEAKVESDDSKVPLAPDNHQFKAPAGVTSIPMFGRQALEATKANNNNLKLEIYSANVTSTSSEFGMALSVTTDSVFTGSEHSFILSKSSGTRLSVSSVREPCDSLVNKSLNESMDNSSVEEVALKVSTDDQETLGDQETVDSNRQTDSIPTKPLTSPERRRRRSRIFTPPVAEHQESPVETKTTTADDQETNESEEDSVSFSKSKTKSPSRRRSTRMLTEQMQEEANGEVVDKTASFTMETDPSDSKQRKTKSPGRRRSSKMVTEQTASTESPVEDVSFGLQDEQANVESESKGASFSMDTSVSKQSKMKSPGRRRSRIFTEQTAGSETPDDSFTLQDEEMEDDRANVDTPPKSASFTMNSSNSKQNKGKLSVKRRRSSKMFTEKTESPAKDVSITLQVEEIKDDQPNVDTPPKSASFTMDSSNSKQSKGKLSVNRRRSTRMFTEENTNTDSPAKDVSFTLQDEEINDNQPNVDTPPINVSFLMDSSVSKQNQTKSPANKRRSTRMFTERSTSTESADVSFTLQDEEVSSVDPKTASFTMDSSASKQTRTKSPGKRRSTRAFAPINTNDTDSTKEIETDPPEDPGFSEKNTSHDSILTKLNKSKSPASGRRSTRIFPDDILPKNYSRFPVEDQENIDSNRKNLMDYSISDLSKINRRTSVRLPENMQDQSLMKFSPRHSMRPAATYFPEEASISESITGRKRSPKGKVDRFSPRKGELNESSSSEPTKQKTPERIDESLVNHSLNVSLPKDSTPDKPPAFFSPYIVTSRGKSSVRKEVQRRRFSQPPPGEIPTKDTVMQSLNISVEEEERTSQYYKYILEREIERLNERCDVWNAIKGDDSIPEDVHYEIQAAVGHTQLLINKKFERFRRLVLDCETGKGEMLVTCKDLQGFWEMMYMEIKDCDNRFNKLEEKKANNWVVEETEEEKVARMQPKKKTAAAKKPAAKKKPVAGKSSIRAHIMAARKKKMEEEGGKEPKLDVEIKEAPIVDPSTPPKNTRRTSTPKSSSKWQSLLKKVQLSQTRKSTTSPLIVMKLGQMCKTPEVQLDDSIVYINSDRTPAKSILKSARDVASELMARSTNKVIFKRDAEVQEFECVGEQTHEEDEFLANIEEPKEPIERRLDFDNDSFDASHASDSEALAHPSTPTINEKLSKILKVLVSDASPTVSLSPLPKVPRIVVSDASPLMISMSPLSLQERKGNKDAGSPVVGSKKTRKQISFKVNDAGGEERDTRTWKFSVPVTPRPKSRSSLEEADEDEDMEVDDSMQENGNDSHVDTPEPRQARQLYMNADGIICERIVSARKATPRSNLRRTNSEVTRRNTRGNTTIASETVAKTPSTPRSRRRNTHLPQILIDSPSTPVNRLDSKGRKSSSTPRFKKHSSRSSEADTTLTEDNANVTVEEAITPKLSKRTPKALSTTKSNSVELNESVKETAAVKLRRSKSLNTTKINVNESGKEPGTPRLRRTNSKLDTTKSSLAESTKEASTPSLKRRHTKKLQENVEPNEQETDEDEHERIKVSRTSSLKRRNSKKYLENIEHSEQQTDVRKKISEALTPNTRRKSLRIAQVSMRNED